MTEEVEPRVTLFERACDWVSAAMGRPTNIIIWAILIATWVLIFAFGGAHVASGDWLPHWFTSQGFNFPLNLITTVAELFIGFFVAAASNRSERNLFAALEKTHGLEDKVVELTQAVNRLEGCKCKQKVPTAIELAREIDTMRRRSPKL